MPSSPGNISGVPVSSASADYVKPADLASRFDVRTIGQLVSDDGQQLTNKAALGHQNLADAITDATGRVISALQHGGRYTIEDLDALTVTSLAHLKRIISTIAIVNLLRRRPGTYTDLLDQFSQEAEGYLKELTRGHDVFTLDPQLMAGVIVDGGVGNDEGASFIQSRNLISDRMIHNVFPHRGNSPNRRTRR